MLYFIGHTNSCSYTTTPFEQFIQWEKNLKEWQLDIETNVTDQVPKRRLKVIQFGNGTDEYVIQWDALTSIQQNTIKNILRQDYKKKYIHNAAFEYITLAYMGIILESVKCTMLQEKILFTGLVQETGFYSLRGLAQRYIGVEMDKSEQKGFDVEFLTDSQILYAAQDVKYLQIINQLQLVQLKKYNLETVANLENAAVCAFGDIATEGMILDIDAWRKNYDWAKETAYQAETLLNSYITDELRNNAVNLGFLKDKDTLNVNWKSPKQKKIIFKEIFPDLEGVTKPIVTKYAEKEQHFILLEFLADKYEPLEEFLLKNYRQFLIDTDFLTPKGAITINWASPAQRLKMFQVVEPGLVDTSKDSLAVTTHKMIQDYKKFGESKKLTTSYGEQFIENSVDIDGKVRTSFNQILVTGRVSSAKPNMQQIPAKKSVGNRYRNCFIAPNDWVFVSSDYNSQELVVIATISQDPVWLAALENGEDLHSICADLVFDKKWKAGALDNCEFNKTKQKCDCPEHQEMRTTIKTINFGLAYGASAHKIATIMQISKNEAQIIVNNYFTVFPSIKGKLTQLGAFGMIKGYILTPPPFNRRRWFEHGPTPEREVIDHIEGDYNFQLGVIERASKNTPIQGGSGDITKLALVYIRRFIRDNKLSDKVKLVMQVHDQIDTICHKDYAKAWSKIMTDLMEKAAKVVIPSGLLTSETNISEKWQK